MADDELWHVRIAADDVKTLTLEQLDDLFRLDVIDGDVLVWQPGMDEWLPLRVVAGIGEEEPEVVNINVSEPPSRPVAATTSTAWPPVAVARQPVASSWPPAVAPSAPPPSSRALPSRPAPPPPSSRAPQNLAAASSWPPAAAWSGSQAPSPFASTVKAGEFPLYPDAKVRAAMDTELRIRPSRSGGTWIVVVALAAGAAVTLYRNAVVHAAAKSMGQETAYLRLESSLGGPSFGTPRAVERMTAASQALHSAVTASTASTPAPVATSTSAPAASSEERPRAESASTPASKSAETAKPAAPSSPRPVAAPAVVTRTTSAPTRHASDQTDPVFKAPKKSKKAKGNEYDPLNPTL